MLRNLPLESIRKKDLVMKSYPEKNGKKALITGITGQDGAYLAELLLKRDTKFTGSSVAPRRSTLDASIISIKILMKTMSD